MSILIAGADTETTGVDPTTGDRIIEVAILTYEWPSNRLVDQYVQRIDPDRNVPASATAVHGITYADLTGKPKWEDVAPEIHKRLDAAALGVAHNASFEELFFGHEILRVGLPLPPLEFFCTMENARWATPDGKLPKLKELCFALGIPFEEARAHGAEYDTAKMMEAFFEGVKRGAFDVPALKAAAMLKAA